MVKPMVKINVAIVCMLFKGVFPKNILMIPNINVTKVRFDALM
ncbi:MAG: hypothetical protein JWR50_621 [Mucilaginibacter sp.]|nr:hypothetical protein [Mucilaginibacter sp.]